MPKAMLRGDSGDAMGRGTKGVTYRPSAAALLATPFLRVCVGVAALGAIRHWQVRGFPPEAVDATFRWGMLALCAMVVLDFARAFLVRYSTSLQVWPDRVVHSTGLLSRRTSRAWTREVVGVDVSRSPLGRLLGYGDVVIETRGVDRLVAVGLADPFDVVDAIERSRATEADVPLAAGENGRRRPRRP